MNEGTFFGKDIREKNREKIDHSVGRKGKWFWRIGKGEDDGVSGQFWVGIHP
jgi:hypothetical protein